MGPAQGGRRRDADRALKAATASRATRTSARVPVRLWFTPTVGQVDLKEARKIIAGAKQAILFLMFNPGPKDTLLNEIIDTARAGKARETSLHPRRHQPGPEHDGEPGGAV